MTVDPLQPEFRGKFRSREELSVLAREMARGGRKLVLTNGVFDLLHEGHQKYLEEASRMGDALAVAVNSDASVRAIKGPTRPVQNLSVRLAQLAALEFIDYVTSFEEPQVTTLLLAIEPQLYAKGGDYTRETIDPTLRDALEQTGIELIFLSHVPGVSTTELLKKRQASE